jgi:lipopolysaccharide export system permease protein
MGKFFSSFLFTLLLFSMITTAIDFSEKVEDFYEKPVTAWMIFSQYYLHFIPYISYTLLPLYVLISVIFFTSRMAANSEVISILNAGVSFSRYLRPFLLSGLILVIVHLLLGHYLVPIGSKIRLKFENTYIWPGNDKGRTDYVHLFTSPDQKIFVKYYVKADSTARDLRIEKFKNGELISLTSAGSARYLGPPDKWKVQYITERTFSGLKETYTQSGFEEKEMKLGLTPADFVQYINQREMMTTTELNKAITRDSERGLNTSKTWITEKYRRTAEAFTILILVVIGVAVASRKIRGGVGLNLAIGLLFGALFIFLSKVSVTFSNSSNIPAILGVWSPNILFLGVAFYFVGKAQK